jgi:hypothetical protein
MAKNPDTVEDWLTLCKSHEDSAKKLCDDKSLAMQGFFHAGMAVECALKAYIFRKERFNIWPSKQIAGVVPSAGDPTAPGWHVVLQWDRAQGYDHNRMPRKVAKGMVEAAFGQFGVVTWIRLTLT